MDRKRIGGTKILGKTKFGQKNIIRKNISVKLHFGDKNVRQQKIVSQQKIQQQKFDSNMINHSFCDFLVAIIYQY